MQPLSTEILLKRDSSTGFSCEFCELFKNAYFAEYLWTAGSETPVRLFKSIFFYRTSPVAASDSFIFPACNFIKNEAPAKTFIYEFCKTFKYLFCQNTRRWLVLVFICEFWEVFLITSFIEHLLETAYFMYKLQNFNHQIQ